MSNVIIKEVECYKEIDIILDGEIIGAAEIKYPSMTLNNFHIHPHYRGKGYGQEALKQIIDTFGVTNLWVSAENDVAKHIYEKIGFVVDSEPKFIYMKK